jgi:4-amino-4-deoxy-L-arabinose transferase-like glycosyltransferase
MRLLRRLRQAVPVSAVLLLVMAALSWYLFVYDAPTPPLLSNLACTLVDEYHCEQDR